MANRNVRQISVFLDGKQVEGSIKNIAGAFREATNRLAKMVVGSEEYIAQLEEVRKYNDALTEHRQRIRGIEEDTQAAAGSMNALQQEVQGATSTLNNLVIGSAEYDEQLRKVQALEAQITEARKNQQSQNIATAGSINAMEQEYQQATKALNMMVVGSDEYNAQLKEVQALEAQLTETRKKQQVQNVATAGSIRALEEELQRERNLLRELVIGTKEYQEQLRKVQQLDDSLTKHQQSLKGVGQGWSLAKIGIDKFVGVAAGAFAVDSLLGYGKQLYGVGVQMDALDKKARTVFGDTLPQVTAEAEKNAAAMGLTTSQYINAAAAIQDILIPMGFQRKEAADISTQLTNLSGALSEWTGGQVSATQVSEILSSALTGEREQLKQLGIVLQEEDIKARLAEKGLEGLTGTMRQQAEAAATLELILEKSTDAQAGFAAGADSAIRRQAELAARTQEVVEKLSTLLLPVFERLVSVIGSVVGAFTDVVDVVGEIANPAKSASDAFSEQAQTVNDLESNILPLLDRYDELTGKTTLTTEEQDELQKIITTVAGVIPTAIEGFDQYGRALGLNTEAAREFIEVERARLKFINQEAIKENEKFIAETQRQADLVLSKLQSGRAAKTTLSTTGPGVRTDFQDLTGSEIQQLQAEAAKLQETLKGANAEVARLKGDTLEVPEVKPPVVTPPGGGGGGGGGKDAIKEAEKLAKDLEDLIERTTEARLDLISKAQDDELAATIRGIEKRYDAEIAKALELEKKGVTEATAQRIALEKLKQEEIGLAVEEDLDKAIEAASQQAKEEAEARIAARKEVEDKDIEERAAALDEIKTFTEDNLLTEQEQELAQLEEHYNQLLELAKIYGADTVAITQAYEAAKAAAVKESAEERIQYEKDVAAAQEELEIQKAGAFAQSAALLGGFFEETSALGKALFLFEKAATAVSVVLSLQKEKAAILAAARVGTLFDPTGLAAAALAAPQIVAANIRAGISLATIAATAIKPFVKQKAEGGFLTSEGDTTTTTQNAYNSTSAATGHQLTVTGEDDRRTYTAAVIPPPNTGLLPHHPVLFQSQATGAPVLASERGAEYFVSSESLRNPYVANLTRMIDNIAAGGRGVPQFAEGGLNTAGATTSVPVPVATAAPVVDMAIIERNTAVMEALLQAINGGIVAVIPDRTLTGIPERLGKINSASGGYFG